ncbi:MAG: hypothetical protein RL596_629 [Bacteroidota bacterium]
MLQTTFVQNKIVRFATHKISKELGTEVSIKHISLAFFNKLDLEGLMIRDKQKDTLVYAGHVRVNITDWFFLKKEAELKYIGLEDATIKLQRKDSIWNYQFIADYFASPSTKKQKKKSGGIHLNLKKVDLKNIHFLQNDLWVGSVNDIKIGTLSIDADKIDLNNNQFTINTLTLTKPDILMLDLPGLRKYIPPKKKKTPKDTSLYFNQGLLDITAKKIHIINGKFYIEGNTKKADQGFDGSHIELSQLNANFDNLRFLKDTLRANINITVKDRSGLGIKKLKTRFKLTPQIMELADLDLQTNKSRLGNYYAMKYTDFKNDFNDYINKVVMVAKFNNARVHSDDIAFFTSELKNWKREALLSGNFKGTVADFKITGLNAKVGATTSATGILTMKGLPDIDKTNIGFNSGTLSTTIYDLGIFLPSLRKVTQPDLKALGNILYRGSFNGSINDFNTNGTVSTKLGGLKANLTMRFPRNAEPIYSGTLETNRFNIGKFLSVPTMGMIDFKGKVIGSSFDFAKLRTKIEGDVASIEYNNYTYTNIEANGTIQKRYFNGSLEVSDPNLGFTSDVEVDFTKEQPLFNIVGDLSKANLRTLNFLTDSIQLAGLIDVNFTGKDIDNFIGSAKFLNAVISNPSTKLRFDSLNLNSTIRNNIKFLHIGSNDFNASLTGKFNINSLPASFEAFLHNYYPAYIKRPAKTPENQQFQFEVNTGYIEPYIKLFTKRFSGFNDMSIRGIIDTKNNALVLDANAPYTKFDNYTFTGISLQGAGNLDSLKIISQIQNIELGDSTKFPSTTINLSSRKDHSVVQIKTSASNTLNEALLYADVYTLEDGARIQFRPSSFVLNEKEWNIEKKGEIIIRKNLLRAQDVKFTQGFQEISIETEEEDGGNTNNLVVRLKDVIIGDITSLILKKERLEGVASGTIRLYNFFGDFSADADLKAEQFRLDKDSIGLVNIKAGYNSKTGKIPFSIESPNEGYNFTTKGSYNIKDSTGNAFTADINLKKSQISILDRFLSDLFTDIKGEATGNLSIHGDINAPALKGDIKLINAGMKVNYTQVYYTIDSAVIKFEEDGINLGKFNIKDLYGNIGTVQGKLYEKGFKNMAFDFDLSTDKLLLIDTKAKDNAQFYGKAIGKANLSFKGPETGCKMTIVAEANDSAHIYIPNSDSKENAVADFIVFKQYGTEMEAIGSKSNFNLSVDLDITANNKVLIDVILDELTGDVIKATGNGRLRITAGTTDPLTIKGRYNIEKGSYDFNFQSILKKPFELLPNAGNYIEWNGDPFKAELHIDAQYTAERVSLSDLVGNNVFSGSVKGYRGDVFVVAVLRNQLNKPSIKFRIDFPQGSPIKNDNEFTAFLNRIERDENEMLKQVSFLIVFNSFAPIGGQSAAGTNNGPNPYSLETLGLNTLSGALASGINRMISGLLYKVFKDPSLKFDLGASLYSSSSIFGSDGSSLQASSNRLDRSRINFKVGKSFLKNNVIVTFGGDLDFNLGASSSVQNGNFQWLPDLTIEIILTQDRKLRAIIFNKNNLDINGANFGRLNRQGVSISYRKDYERLFGTKEKELLVDIPKN